MDIKELRIGNLIYSELHSKDTNHTIVDVHFLGLSEYVKFWGILLTEEWLLKFRFKKIKDPWITIESFHYENKNCWIYLIEKGFEFELITMDERNNLCKTYNYVHQLQNLYFAITGEELQYLNVTQHVKV